MTLLLTAILLISFFFYHFYYKRRNLPPGKKKIKFYNHFPILNWIIIWIYLVGFKKFTIDTNISRANQLIIKLSRMFFFFKNEFVRWIKLTFPIPKLCLIFEEKSHFTSPRMSSSYEISQNFKKKLVNPMINKNTLFLCFFSKIDYSLENSSNFSKWVIPIKFYLIFEDKWSFHLIHWKIQIA